MYGLRWLGDDGRGLSTGLEVVTSWLPTTTICPASSYWWLAVTAVQSDVVVGYGPLGSELRAIQVERY